MQAVKLNINWFNLVNFMVEKKGYSTSSEELSTEE
jgi:hypothetical protein